MSPAKSEQQQKAAGLALAAKRKEVDPSRLRGAAKEMYESMTVGELRKFAGTSHRGIPKRT